MEAAPAVQQQQNGGGGPIQPVAPQNYVPIQNLPVKASLLCDLTGPCSSSECGCPFTIFKPVTDN